MDKKYFFKLLYVRCVFVDAGAVPKAMGCNPWLVFCSVLLLAINPCYFLCLDTKKVTKENSRLQIILGLLFFGLPSQYNSFHLISFGVTQTVLLTAGPRSKPQNSRFIPKFSEAEINPKTNNINTFYILKREGKPRNGANCSQNDSANKASVAGARFG